ncbi:MAG: hypothetical protein L0Y71_01985 [Gemmataceae bacterium]|nr:hypothetical protein [Gemmataceae bacterium]
MRVILAQLAGAIGVVLAAASWTGYLSPLLGWTGVVIAVVCAIFLLAPQPVRLESPAGVPVAPTGVWVQPDTPLEPGSLVLACSQGHWWRARVLALEDRDRVRVNFVGWDPRWEESHRRSQLQLDEDLAPLPELPAEPSQPPVPASDPRIQRK